MTTICDSVEIWEDWYKPINNTIADSNGESIIFETFGDEYEFVKNAPFNKVWTWVDGEGGTYILAGWHFVNRIGYFVTEVEWTDAHIEIPYEKFEVEV